MGTLSADVYSPTTAVGTFVAHERTYDVADDILIMPLVGAALPSVAVVAPNAAHAVLLGKVIEHLFPPAPSSEKNETRSAGFVFCLRGSRTATEAKREAEGLQVQIDPEAR